MMVSWPLVQNKSVGSPFGLQRITEGVCRRGILLP